MKHFINLILQLLKRNHKLVSLEFALTVAFYVPSNTCNEKLFLSKRFSY